jgi:hypothetical protein
MLNYLNDPLLVEENTNDLIKQNRGSLIFLNESKTLNLFSAFVKKSDFEHKEKITQPLQKTVYLKVNKEIAKQLRKRALEVEGVKKLIESYTTQRSNCNAAISKWFGNGVFPLILLRVLSRNERELSRWISGTQYFTDFLHKSRFYPPLTLEELLDKKLIYLVGCSIGDGHIDHFGKRWCIVDGSSDKARLSLSEEFVQSLSSILKIYGVVPTVLLAKNKYIIKANNKLFCRFLNFFFGLPFGKKKNHRLSVPLILEGVKSDLEKYFWRGCFDTDGSAIGSVSFSSSDQNMFRECKAYLFSKGINPVQASRSIVITAADTKKFCCVGFAHPRKQIEFIEKLKVAPFVHEITVKSVRKVPLELLNVYKVLRIDKGYRVRINSKELKRKRIDYNTVNQIMMKLFGRSFSFNSKGFYYFKSKEAYDYLRRFFIYGRAWGPITEEDELQLLDSWNDVWKK